MTSLLIAASLFLSALAFAGGVVVVGKGGGFAEMQAYEFDQSQRSITTVCLQSNNPCRLTPQEAEWVQALDRDLQDSRRPLLKINVTCLEPMIRRDAEGSVSIEACALYQERTKDLRTPRDVRDIMKLVLQASLLRVHPQEKPEDLRAVREKLLLAFESVREARSYPVPQAVSGLTLHDWSVRLGAKTINRLTFEGVTRSVDLTKDLEAQLGCENSLTWDLQTPRFQERSTTRTEAQAALAWSCGEQSFRGELLLGLEFEGGELRQYLVRILRRIRL